MRFISAFVRKLQANIVDTIDLKHCVTTQMLEDRSKLGKLFQICGQAELNFLTNSGLWFGFLLGMIQMCITLLWDNPWVMSVGGGVVGFATNWLALKWIFQPVNPTKVGPFVLQGMFLKRQKEVSETFSKFFANNILTSEKVGLLCAHMFVCLRPVGLSACRPVGLSACRPVGLSACGSNTIYFSRCSTVY